MDLFDLVAVRAHLDMMVVSNPTRKFFWNCISELLWQKIKVAWPSQKISISIVTFEHNRFRYAQPYAGQKQHRTSKPQLGKDLEFHIQTNDKKEKLIEE